MWETEASLLPKVPQGTTLKVFCVGFDEEFDDSSEAEAGEAKTPSRVPKEPRPPAVSELERLLSTLGVKAVGKIHVSVRRVNPATFIGAGKVQEVAEQVVALGADAVVIDTELSPNQLRNLEKAIGKPTVDRPGIIIEIFSQHARTKESKTQVELAKLQYLLPRLAHYWTHFERQRGGIGQKGMGEKQIEVDRRLVKKRMEILRKRLGSIGDERDVQRSSRKDVIKVALVGYTNAGKSTLLNSLTDSHVLVENKLFSTLDSSVRALNPHSQPPVVAIDTVGFIDRLPPGLIASFRSTLEELQHADLLLHVVDGSSPKARDQIDVTESVLKDLKLDKKPKILVLNKMDLLAAGGAGVVNRSRAAAPGAVRVSAFNRDDMKRLRELIMAHFQKAMESWEVMIPYTESKLEAMIRAHGNIEKTKHLDSGTFFRVRMPEEWANKLQLKKFQI